MRMVKLREMLRWVLVERTLGQARWILVQYDQALSKCIMLRGVQTCTCFELNLNSVTEIEGAIKKLELVAGVRQKSELESIAIFDTMNFLWERI